MARNSDYPEHVGSTDGAYALMAVDLGGGAFRLRWVHTETLGEQGPVGVPGPAGADSSTPGEKGDTGTKGATGPAGPAGVNGIPGVSAAVTQPNIYLDDGFAVEVFEDYADGQSSGFNAGRGWSGDWVTSGANIVTRTSHNGIIQKRLAVTSGQIGRSFRFGDKWNKIQVAVLARIDSLIALTAMNYYFGVCSGTADMAASVACANFIGQAGVGITWATLSKVQQDALVASATLQITRRGNVNTVNATLPAGLTLPTTEASLGVLWMEINRSPYANDAASVTYSHRIRAVLSSTATSGMSVMKEAFLNSLHTSLGSSDSYVGTYDSTITPSFDQSTGGLDTFNLFWDCPTPIEIAAVAIRKVY